MKQKVSIAIILGLALIAIVSPSNAIAKSSFTGGGGNGGGGNGGGGGGSTETGTPFVFTYSTKINGVMPTWTGTYILDHSIPGYYTWDSLQISLKGKPVGLPDGTLLNVTIYTSDIDLGISLPPINAPKMSCTGKVGTAKSNLVIYNPANITYNRHVDGVIISAPDGTVLAVCHG